MDGTTKPPTSKQKIVCIPFPTKSVLMLLCVRSLDLQSETNLRILPGVDPPRCMFQLLRVLDHPPQPRRRQSVFPTLQCLVTSMSFPTLTKLIVANKIIFIRINKILFVSEALPDLKVSHVCKVQIRKCFNVRVIVEGWSVQYVAVKSEDL